MRSRSAGADPICCDLGFIVRSQFVPLFFDPILFDYSLLCIAYTQYWFMLASRAWCRARDSRGVTVWVLD
uniref:Uncharacterized protein n=1 Tax=Arundo donax TaxID=35708 RepID=A0A0A9DN11_ARUDO